MGLISRILGVLTTVVASLPQNATNGGTQLGTLVAPLLSNFLTNNPLPSGFPWGMDTAFNTNPYTQSPNTGRLINTILTNGRLIDSRGCPVVRF